MKNRLELLISLLFAIFCLSTSDSLADSASTTVQPFRIGMIYSLTGPAETWASYGRQAAELAAKEINSAGGVGGRSVELVFEDSRTTSAGAVAAYNKLVKVDKVDTLIGDVWDHVTNPLVSLTVRDKIVLVSPTVIPDSITDRSEYFFTLGAQISLTRDAVRKFFELSPEVTVVALVIWDNPWGQATAEVWREVASERGVSILDERSVYGFDYDYRTDASQIARKRPDAVIMGFHEDRIIKRLSEQGLRPKILSTSNLTAVHSNKLLSEAELEGAYYTDWLPEPAFKESFEREYGRAPMFEAQNHYQAVKALVSAYDRNPSDLRAGLRKIKRRNENPPIDFSEGFAANYSEATLFKIVSGEAVPVN